MVFVSWAVVPKVERQVMVPKENIGVGVPHSSLRMYAGLHRARVDSWAAVALVVWCL